MSIAAFILGLIGFLFSLSPLFFGLSVLLFLIALPLGLIGRKKSENRGLGIAAIILSIAGFAVIVGHSFMVVNGIKKSGEGINSVIKDSIDSDQIQITGFGGYELGEQLDPNKLSEKDLKRGYVERTAKKMFRNFGEITLFFTPKTFFVHQISSQEKGGEEDVAVIKASVEKKYNAEMERQRFSFPTEHFFTRSNRSFFIKGPQTEIGGSVILIHVVDHDLQKLNDKEKEEITQSKVDTRGL